MDKKLLVSLMMTAPVAVGAQAAYVASGGVLSYQILPQVDSANWDANGLVSDDKPVATNGVLSCPVSAGYLSHIANLSLPGSYTFKAVNCENVVFVVGGTEQWVKDANGKDTTTPAMEFSVLSSGMGVDIKAVPIKNDGVFKVGTVTMQFYFNFNTAKTSLETQFNKIELTQVPSDDNKRQNAKDLIARYKTLSAEYTKISKDLASINLDDAKSLEDAWNNFKLSGWNATLSKATDNLSVAILNLQNNAGLANTDGTYPKNSYNADVAAETVAWNNILTNKANLADLEAKIADLKKDLAAKKDVNKTVPSTATADQKEYCKLALAKELADEDAAIKKLEGDVKAQYVTDKEGNLPNEKVIDDSAFNTTVDNISAAIAAITAENAIADYNAYEQFVKDLAQQKYQFDTIFASINTQNNYNVTEYSINGVKYTVKNVYDDVTGIANNKLADAYGKNEYKGFTPGAIVAVTDKEGNVTGWDFVASAYEDILGTRNNLTKLQKEMADRLVEMQKAESELKGLYDAQQAELNGADGADAIIKGLQATCDSYKKFAESDAFAALLPADQTKLNELIDAMQTAIDNLASTTNKEYLAHELDVDADPFATDKAAVDTADENYNNYLKNKIGQDVIDLIISSNEARAYVKTKTAKVSKYGSTLNAKFDSSFKNIDDAITTYYKSDPKDPQAVKDINAAIKTVKDACDKLVQGVGPAVTAISNAQTNLDNFRDQLDNKTLIGVGAPYNLAKYSTTADEADYSKYKKELSGYDNELNNIINDPKLSVQELYDAAVAEAKKVNDSNIAANIKDAQDAFVKAATQKNSENVGAMVNAIYDYVNTDPTKSYPGMDKVDLTKDVNGGYAKLLSLYNAEAGKIAGAGADTTQLDAIDKALEDLVTKCADVNAKIKAVLDNHDAWVRLGNTKTTYANSITTYSANLLVNELTVSPAREYYIGELSKLITELNNIATKYDASYNAVTEVTDEKGYKAELDKVNTDFGDLQKALLENQKNYSTLNGISDNLSIAINSANETLDKYDDVEYTENGKDVLYTQEYQEKVAKITKELGNLNDAVTASFGKGDLTDGDLVDEYTAKYKELTSQLSDIMDEWTGGYYSAVVKANNDWFADHNLGTGFLDEKYKDAIAYVNEYLYNVYNVNYYQLLVNNPEFIENHNELQACFKKIETLTNQLNAYKNYIAPKPAENEELDPETLKVLGVNILEGNTSEIATVDGKQVTLKSLVTDANKIVATIEKTLANIDKKGLEVANDFWKNNGVVAENAWNTITQHLAKAGFSVEGRTPGEESEIDQFYGAQLSVLNSMLDAYDQDQADITAGKTYAVHKYILDMDNWANIIAGKPTYRTADDLALLPEYGDRDAEDVAEFVNEKVYAAINALWPERVSDANSKLAELLEEIEDYNLDPDFAADKKVITDAQNSVTSYVNNWSTLSNADREKNLAAYQAALNKLVTDAQDAVDKAKAAHGIIVNNNEVIAKVITNTDSYYNQGLKNIDDLLEWSNYRENQLEVIETLSKDLEAAKAKVYSDVTNSSKANLNTEKAVIEAVSVTDVNSAYITIFGYEKDFANDLMVLLRSAFNNVNLKYSNEGIAEEKQDELNGYDTRIKALEKELKGIAYKVKDRKGCMNDLEACETAISKLLVELQGLAIDPNTGVNTDTKASTLNDLDNTAKNVSGAISKFQKETVDKAEIVGEGTNVKALQETYNSKISNLEQALSGIESKYNGDGDNVIWNAAQFTYDMQQLLDQLSGVESDWSKAYDNTGTPKGALQKDINEHYYGLLSNSLNTLWDETQYAYVEARDHRNATWDYQLYNQINQDINGWTGADGVFHNGDKQRLENLYNSCSITKNTTLMAGLQDNVYGFVRQTLKAVASSEVEGAQDQAGDLVNAIQNPGVNENGWQQSFINAEETWKSIVAELRTIENLNVWEIIYYIQNNNTYLTTPTQAKAAYETIMAAIEEGRTNMGDIYDKAVEEDLIVKGDVKADKKINILDVQELIDLVTKAPVYDGTSKNDHIADVNSDEELNVADVTTLINWVIGGQNNNAQHSLVNRLRKFMPVLGANNTYRVEEVQGENGLRRYAVLLTNETAFAAGQLNIVLPSHARVAGVSLGERANGLDAYVKDNGGFTTVVMTALDQTMISGDNGCVLFIDVEGNAEVQVENVIFSDRNGSAYHLNEFGSTGVGIIDSVKDGVKAIYNAAGQKLNKLTKGVNIIRNADGTVTKKMGK